MGEYLIRKSKLVELADELRYKFELKEQMINLKL